MKNGSLEVHRAHQLLWIVAIVSLSAATAMIFSWRAPGLSLYARDRLMQARGPIAPPDDLVIVAIDEASVARYGRFPWPRTLTARALDAISSAQPRAIALDVLYSEPTNSTDDTALGDSIKRAGNTVVAAQLVEATDDVGAPVIRWLRPLQLLETAAAGIGHVNVSTEVDGQARELLLRNADDQGQALWSIAVETIRVGEGVRAGSVRDVPGGIQLGTRKLPIEQNITPAALAPHAGNSHSHFDTLRADRMIIDYVGPPGSFLHQTFSFVDVLDGRVSPQSFRGKYVIIGATAATLGDNVASPFVHTEGPAGEQHGELMPGVEVLANAMNTILRGRFYREIPDWVAALLAAFVAAGVIASLAIAQGRFESFKQICTLLALLTVILVASYIAFVHWLIVPPVVPALLAFVTATPLALLRRSLRTSADLDTRIAELTSANELLLLSPPAREFPTNANAATLIAHLAGSSAVAIYASSSGVGGPYRLVASHGAIAKPSLTENEVAGFASLEQTRPHYSVIEASRTSEGLTEVALDDFVRADPLHQARAVGLLLANGSQHSGALLIGSVNDPETRTATLRLCAEIATSYLGSIGDEGGSESVSLLASSWWRLPRGVEWKARALGVLNRRILARARFVDRALRSVEDGLIVADISGRIAFSNPRAAEILGVAERTLLGGDLFHRLGQAQQRASDKNPTADHLTRELLTRVVLERATVEREITLGAPPRYYMLRLSAVTAGDEGTGQILGLVAALSDVTQQHELQEMKSDVMTLVTHELITPLTAIQGMSEVLAQFEVNKDRCREMHLAINDESKRLSQMIREYLDITRLESGAHPLRLAPLRLVPLIERVLLLLDPLAAQRNITIVRRLAPDLPVLMADSDLIAQALTNLIANAIKYSPPKTQIRVDAYDVGDALLVEVRDQGHGISAEALPHIFEKFYRVPRIEDADVPGTGLGLALVREIVGLHGGRVTVESEVEVGSTFCVRLPLPSRVT